MGEAQKEEKYIHVRCSPALKRQVKMAAAATDRNLSDHVRETLADASEEDLDEADELSVDA